jgi:hypothetical protein
LKRSGRADWGPVFVGRFEHEASLPRSVSEKIGVYFKLLKNEDARFVRGVYLLGSTALGDYQEGRSDIDFGAMVDGPLDGGMIDLLDRVHHAMASLGGPSFDGFYVEARRLRRAPIMEEPATFSLNGSFHRDAPCFECNAMTWLLWSTRGVALFGPPPQELRIALDQDGLRSFQIANLEGYWRNWIEGASARLARKSKETPVDAAAFAWGVLGVARIACTLATGRAVSKTEAGTWALAQYGREHRVVVDLALALRRGEAPELTTEHAMAALKLMEKVRASAIAASF